MTISPERLKQLQNLPDREIDTSEIPELDETFWKNAKKRETVTIPLDPDILTWLKQQTPQYPQLINQVLRAYMNQHSSMKYLSQGDDYKMDKLAYYRDCIQKLLTEYSRYSQNAVEVESLLCFDVERDRVASP